MAGKTDRVKDKDRFFIIFIEDGFVIPLCC